MIIHFLQSVVLLVIFIIDSSAEYFLNELINLQMSTQFTILYDKEKQQLIRFEPLESENCLKDNRKIQNSCW